MSYLLDLKAAGFLVSKSTFEPSRDIPDLSGKVIIVTGANTGIGKETAKQLVAKGAKVYAACRSEEKANEAIKEIQELTGKSDIHFLKLDLGSVKSSISSAEAFLQRETRLDVLINSAGVMFTRSDAKNADGLEMQFGTNVISPFAFTERLIPLLKETAKVSPKDSVRIVWVSSSAHYFFASRKPDGNGIDFDSVTKGKHLNNKLLYGQSKLANIQMSNWYARELKNDGVVNLSLHPGNIASDLTRHLGIAGRIINMALYPVSSGALTQLYCAVSPDIKIEDSGSYYVPWAQKHHTSHPTGKCQDREAIEKTMDFCRSQVESLSQK